MKVCERKGLMYKKHLALEIMKRCLKIEAIGFYDHWIIWCVHSYLHEQLFSETIFWNRELTIQLQKDIARRSIGIYSRAVDVP